MDYFIRDTRNEHRIGPYTSKDAEAMVSALNDYVRRNRLPSNKGPQDPFVVVEPVHVSCPACGGTCNQLASEEEKAELLQEIPCHYCGALMWTIDESSRRTTCCGAL